MTFADFFRAVWGKDPFPWQEELAAQALLGEWPRWIGLPTAAGKTALIDIAVYALAMRAPKAARRIFFVVDRRVVVDEAANRAVDLKNCLAKAAPGTELGKLAQRLRDLGGGEPLKTAALRGGTLRDDAWAHSPQQPLVVCSTVDQVGSGLLFRAYGTSEYGRSIRAGLTGNDALIILDEAHTSRAFAETLKNVARYREWAEEEGGLGLPFTVIEMSATPKGEGFTGVPGDLENQVLKQRWNASKRTQLVLVDAYKEEEAEKGGFTGLAQALAKEAWVLRESRGAKVIGVIANRVRTARRVHEMLAGDADCDAILLTGRSRPYDRDTLWADWKDAIGLDRKEKPERPVFVVATQCIEVGANLNFDGLVTEIASIDALEQRFGRLDRDGETGQTHATIVAQKDQVAKKYTDFLYGAAMQATWDWLKKGVTTETREEVLSAEGKKRPKRRKVKEEFVEMGVLALRAALKEAADVAAMRMPAPHPPVLLPAHVDLLCQTSPEPAVSPDAAVYLHGPEAGPPDVQVVWRADLGDNHMEWADLTAVCPPGAAESLAVPLSAVWRWLAKDASGSELSDLEGEAVGRRAKSEIRTVLVWRGVGDRSLTEVNISPGMTIVVPATYGGCDQWGWNPDSVEPVKDVGDAVKWKMGRPILRLDERLAAQWGYEELAAQLRSAENARDVPAVAEASEDWIREVIAEFRKRAPKVIGHPHKEIAAALEGRSAFDQSDVRSSYADDEVELVAHLGACAAKANAFGACLSPLLRRTVERAGQLHDIGKADPRFQAWLRGGNAIKAGELIAKSARSGQNWPAIKRARELAGYPKGGRHELLSAALLSSTLDAAGVDFDLLLHLVASHHGYCRPFAPVVKDEEPLEVGYEGRRAISDHGLERVGSGVSERFWKLTRRYGWYGLAYLETVLRLADHRVSESEGKEKAAHV